MKKLSVLLVAVAVALSASAVNHKLVNNVKTSVKEVKAMAGQRQTMTITWVT